MYLSFFIHEQHGTLTSWSPEREFDKNAHNAAQYRSQPHPQPDGSQVVRIREGWRNVHFELYVCMIYDALWVWYIYVCVYIYIYMRVCMHVCIYTRMYVCMYASVSVYVHIQSLRGLLGEGMLGQCSCGCAVCICTYINTYNHKHKTVLRIQDVACMHVYMCACLCMYACMYICAPRRR